MKAATKTESDPDSDSPPGHSRPDEWPRPGSTYYYALRHQPGDVHARVHATLQLIETVTECLLDVTEPTVAEKKIHWWHEEIDRLINAEPRHPATVAFKANFPQLHSVERLSLIHI